MPKIIEFSLRILKNVGNMAEKLLDDNISSQIERF